MIMLYKRIIAAVLVSAVLMPAAASAQGLLGGVLGGGSGGSSVLGLVGDGDSGALITVESGNAGTSGTVNIGLGGSEGLVTANAGAGERSIGAQVLGPSSVVGFDVNMGDTGAGVELGGPNIIDVTLNTPGGNDGSNGSNGSNGANGNGGPFPIFNRGTSGSSSPAPVTAACSGYDSNQLLSVFNNSTVRGWNSANGIQLVPIKVCADLRRQMANWLQANGEYHRLVGAVAEDPLINAALSRTRYGPGHVLGVHKQGSTLMVYVF